MFNDSLGNLERVGREGTRASLGISFTNNLNLDLDCVDGLNDTGGNATRNTTE